MSDSEFIALGSAERRFFRWIDDPLNIKIVSALEAAAPGGVRYVGGCVRDSLLGIAPKDIDVATVLTPEETVRALEAAGLRSAPTGIAHGTITAIADGHTIEVTTLRADVSTDGRRATVAFTKDWLTDACRRDFRLNAIYLTPDGKLFDPVGGLADARSGTVRFIGNADDRLREDYLRILRFFRFSARFAEEFDEDGLRACAANKEGIAQLSAERIGAELSLILEHAKAAKAIEMMAAAGVLGMIWETPADIDALRVVKDAAPDAGASVGLAALFGEAGEGIGARLRLSNANEARRRAALAAKTALETPMSEAGIRRAIYHSGNGAIEDGALLALAAKVIGRPMLEQISALASHWPRPSLPISGKDLVAHGVLPGPQVSAVLSRIEARWIEEDFPEEARVRAILAEEIAAI